MTELEHLQQIAQAVHQLHDDAWSSLRAVSHQPIVENEFTRPYLQANELAVTHPHLRHASGAGSAPTPAGDQQARALYIATAATITDAYDALVPPQMQERRRGPAAGPPAPLDLVGMLAMIRRVLLAWDRMGQRARDLDPVRVDHERRLQALAARLRGWRETWTRDDEPVCARPNDYRGCHGWPVRAGGMCAPCYHHDRRQQTRAS